MPTIQKVDDFLLDPLVFLVDHDEDVVLVVLQPFGDVHLLAGDVVLDLAQFVQALLLRVPEVGLPYLPGPQSVLLKDLLALYTEALETGAREDTPAALASSASEVLLEGGVSAHLLNFIFYYSDQLEKQLEIFTKINNLLLYC